MPDLAAGWPIRETLDPDLARSWLTQNRLRSSTDGALADPVHGSVRRRIEKYREAPMSTSAHRLTSVVDAEQHYNALLYTQETTLSAVGCKLQAGALLAPVVGFWLSAVGEGMKMKAMLLRRPRP